MSQMNPNLFFGKFQQAGKYIKNVSFCALLWRAVWRVFEGQPFENFYELYHSYITWVNYYSKTLFHVFCG
jgi:hypothetical protein